MDLNCYNLHFVVGLFGMPKAIKHYPNISNGIDTSGTVILNYPNFICICTAAKDSNGKAFVEIQGGDAGTISIESPTSLIEAYTVTSKDGIAEKYNHNLYEHRMINTFIEIIGIIKANDFDQCHQLLDHSILLVTIIERLRESK